MKEKLRKFFGLNGKAGYNLWLQIKSPRLKNLYDHRKRQQALKALKLVNIVQALFHIYLLVRVIFITHKFDELAKFVIYIPLTTPLLLHKRFPKVLDYCPTVALWTKLALIAWSRTKTMEEMPINPIVLVYGALLPLLYYIIACLWLSTSWLRATLTCVPAMALFYYYTEIQLLPIYLDQLEGLVRQLNQIRGAFGTLASLVLLIVATHYNTDKFQMGLFIEGQTLERERKQLRDVLDLLPAAVIITTDLPAPKRPANPYIRELPSTEPRVMQFINKAASQLTGGNLEKLPPEELSKSNLLEQRLFRACDEDFAMPVDEQDQRKSLISMTTMLRIHDYKRITERANPKPRKRNSGGSADFDFSQTIGDLNAEEFTERNYDLYLNNEQGEPLIVSFRDTPIMYGEKQCRLIFLLNHTENQKLQQAQNFIEVHNNMAVSLKRNTKMPLEIAYAVGAVKNHSDNQSQVQLLVNAATQIRCIVNDQSDYVLCKTNKFFSCATEFELKPAIEEVLGFYKFKAKKQQLSFKVKFDDLTLPKRLVMDKNRMQQVVSNVLSNAVNNTLDGGIDVNCRFNRHGEWLEIQVTDTGLGIAEEDQAKIFEELKPNKQGPTGLGLCISRMIAKNLQGDIVFNSELGKGSTFQIILAALDPDGLNNIVNKPA